jgi:ribosomal 50S subunit-recycling heat shock protein
MMRSARFIDEWPWYARLMRNCTIAAVLVGDGLVRLNAAEISATALRL